TGPTARKNCTGASRRPWSTAWRPCANGCCRGPAPEFARAGIGGNIPASCSSKQYRAIHPGETAMSSRKPGHEPPPSEITPEAVWLSRREWMARAGLAAAAAGLPAWAARRAFAQDAPPLAGRPSPQFSVMDKQTSFKDVSTYNNYYEFGVDKSDPAEYAGKLQTRPWSVVVEGEVRRPQTFDIDALLKLAPMEDRVYRLRCVEGWSMVIPWVGYPLSALLKQVEPTGNARYVEFTTVVQRENMPGVRYPVLEWPYIEGLRLDEAMHPLALLVFGVYGKVL